MNGIGAMPASARKLLVSVHIPKTAGTSLTVEIRRGALGRHRLDYGICPRPAACGIG